ncbi:hypothetical protein CSA37_09295 [Candidatus Fermentibacteria bacterium]|nr:MAG: hypothetical protein CSA37_09295 [Candidatus Fermentibacteria bacterium]
MIQALVLLAASGIQLQQTELANGLDVIVNEDHSSNVVTVCITVNTGATCESPETNGLAHFYEHMFFKGNGALPDQTAYNERMRELGIVRNGITSSEMVRYFLTVPSHSFHQAMEFMFDAITTPLFDEEEIVRERSVIMNEYQRNTSSPWWNLWKAKEQVLAVDPWRSNSIGVPEVIEAASRQVMMDFQHTYYTPDNSALIISGDVNAAEATEAAEEMFSSWEYGGRSDYSSLPLNISIPGDTLVHVSGPQGIASISIVFRGPSMVDQQEWTYAADVWGQYMSAMTGEFQERLVTDGPFLNVYASYYTQRFEPTITFGGTIQADKAREGYDLLRGEIERMFEEEYFTESGLNLALEQLRRHRLFACESAVEMATETLPFWWVQGDGLDYYLEYPEKLASVSQDDVKSFINTWIAGQPSAVFVVTPEGRWSE